MARRSTIANKWFLKSFSVVLIVLLLLDIVLYFVFRSYYYSSAESILKGEVNVVSAVLTRYYTGSGGTGYSGEIRRTIEGFDKKDHMELMMINEEGRVTITSSGFTPATAYDMPDYDTAVSAENGMGVYNGYQRNGERVMAVTVMLDIPDENYCAVRVVSSLSKVDVQLGMTMLFIVFMSGGVILLMLTLGLYFIRSIVIPLRQISGNAQRIARGDFSV
ncbi:MAG: sensor histidine kinase, partial [Ruminiclostridium sp.]|nr:sensor histidine kinase [Ruminiclostridium sp.]